MPLSAPPSCHCFEAADSTIRFIGRRFNSTRGRNGPSVSEYCMVSPSHGLKVSMLRSAAPPVFEAIWMPNAATGPCNGPARRWHLS